MKINSRLYQISVIIILILGVSILPQAPVSANVPGWNAGNIINDYVFTKNDTMSVNDIQSFLNSKVPNCDTNGSKTSEYGGGTRAQWGQANYGQSTFTCLKNYSQNGKSAAQIIYDTAQRYKINPQVLIVLLQKEQGLVTDEWPLNIQYRSATGYGCPDTAPCDSQYYGLTNQLDWAGKMFRAIIDDSPTWYTPYNLGTNFIRYSPTASCGGSNVNIQNRATQALYNYTPYQPNQGALNAGWGTASCGAYGNRNFYLYFTSWFGSTQTPAPPYSWEITQQRAYVDINRNISFNRSISIEPEEKIYLTIKAKNTGSQTWTNTSVTLNTSKNNNRSSVFSDESWANPHQINMVETTVAPGNEATFNFSMTAPEELGTYYEYFNLVANGSTWLRDYGLYIPIDVTTTRSVTNSEKTRLSSGEMLTVNDYLLSPDTQSTLRVQLDGNLVLYSNFRPTWASGTSGSRGGNLQMQTDGNLVLYNASNSPIWSSNTSGNPGAYLSLQTDGNLVLYNASNSPIWSSGTISTPNHLRVVEKTMPTAIMYPKQTLMTANLKHKLVLQEDGNLVQYSNGSPIWASGTDGQNIGKVIMQSDGNLVMYRNDGRPVWATDTSGNYGAYLTMNDDGVISLNAGGSGVLLNNAILQKGQALRSTNNSRVLVLQLDGNLVIYSNGRPVWASNTSGKSPGVLRMQSDGNLVLYDANGRPVWASNTSGKGKGSLRMQSDGNLVMYNAGGRPYWASQTSGR